MGETHFKSEDNPYNISYEDYLETNACTECTGLMYLAAEGQDDWDSYREIFDFTPAHSRDKPGK
jgi:hypothetical protein